MLVLPEDEPTISLDVVPLFVTSRDLPLVAAWELSGEYLDRWLSEGLASILPLGLTLISFVVRLLVMLVFFTAIHCLSSPIPDTGDLNDLLL